MSDRTQEFRVGVVALATIVIVMLLVALNTGTSLPFGGTPYVVQIRVDRAPGVGPNTPIRKDGVLIGRVIETSFVPGGGVLVLANIQPGAPIYQSDRCRVQPSSLFGDAVINFSYDGDGVNPVPIEDGSQIPGEAVSDPIETITQLQVDIGPAIHSIGEAAEGITKLAQKLDSFMGVDIDPDEVTGLIAEARLSAEQFRNTMQKVSVVAEGIDEIFDADETKETMDQLAKDLPQLIADARDTVGRASTTLESLGGVIESAETNLNNLQGFTKPLGDRGEELAGMLTGSIENLGQALGDIAEFTAALSNSQGTIARLVNDPTLYDNLSTVIGNTNIVLVQANDFIKTLRPVAADARVFMDKIAREPGRLVGGAINRGPGIK